MDAGGQSYTFADDTRSAGTLAPVPDREDGPRWWPDLWSIFIPDGASTTLAALPAEEQNRIFNEWKRGSAG
ncbi:non-canonical purine NTP pyrophosphatase [Streptomyces roseochromogenus]|uniref:non-canonical purine NTP pyrophosphatase n=1 Tax=Streptomyces roseochromogenus TaxID=285450 RepID=UPI001FD80F8A|nr:non-canonical purine NTP pyrophosphatase [Streptomyces roseochromogenus]